MRLLLLSDLHREFGDIDIPENSADVIVLAGDIDIGTRGVGWAKRVFDKPVVYVGGNHENYGHSVPAFGQKLRDAAEGSNVRFLENDSVIINGVRFLGCTLWTDFAPFWL